MAQWSKTNVIEITQNLRIDSEFFHPMYIDAENLVNNCKNVLPFGQLGKFIIGPFGSAFHVNNYDPDSEFRYVRGKDVKPFTLLDDDNVYMPEKDFKRLSRYSLEKDDLLISVVGTLGNVAIVQDNIKGIFSCKSTVFRNSKINPYYLLAYFNSKYGRQCLLRRQRGAIQMGLNKEDLKTIPVPIFNDKIIKNIGEKIFNSLRLIKESKTLWVKATNTLNNELELYKVNLKKTKYFISNANEVVSERRMNAEYFYPHIKEILNQPFLNESKQLGLLYNIIRGNTPDKYVSSGIPVIKTKNVRIPEVDIERINDFVENKNEFISTLPNDLLLASMGVGSLGRMSIISPKSERLIIDGTIRLLRRNSLTPNNFEIPTLLFLTSDIGQELIYRGIVGSTGIISLPDEYLRKIPIPIFRDNLCNTLTDLVNKSMEAKTKSYELLEEAKQNIERLIEQS